MEKKIKNAVALKNSIAVESYFGFNLAANLDTLSREDPAVYEKIEKFFSKVEQDRIASQEYNTSLKFSLQKLKDHS